ncbi:UNVERIFIED_CONTAM: hypothetical protein Slati_2716500 [Sesamum latifolium]|uniref:SWIM-type domain-containing protein n=1 Tax=Sesamum latifolium TaxID=2727402 RepID=A0AAW2VWQ5_9LAMI
MQELAEINQNAANWLSDKPPTQWSRSHFSLDPKCETLLNNCCEIFNSNILKARKKSILTMFEWLREYLMIRLQESRDRAKNKWVDKKICPRIKKIIEKNMSKVSDCIPLKADDYHYEIMCFDGSRLSVDFARHSCACRKWDLTGIPCKHALTAILSKVLTLKIMYIKAIK